MSFSAVTGTCLLSEQPCLKVEKHDDFMLMIFREQGHVDCVVWVRDQSGVVPARMITGPDNAQISRVSDDGELLVGQAYNPGQDWYTYIAEDGNWMRFSNEDLRTVHSNCTMAWVPYKAGDSLPRKTVVTGMLADGRRLYSSLSWHTSCCWRIGSYAEGDTAAYYMHGGSKAVTDFDILVEVWKKRGKSEGFDSCDRPSNLTQIGFKSSICRPCDLEIWWMTPKNNKTRLLYNIKLCVALYIHQWIQTGVTVRKRPIWVKLDDFF